jgi:hypothetical protein
LYEISRKGEEILKKIIRLKHLETVHRYVEASIGILGEFNKHLKELTGKNSYSIDHLIFVLTIERENIIREKREIEKRIEKLKGRKNEGRKSKI